ncbi:MAG: hypothetical protein OHK0029_24160 [Armatimonadaceae bacterium]
MPIELSPALEADIREAAQDAGVDPATFIQEAVADKIRQNSFARPLTESQLLERINAGFSEDFWNRYRHLITCRDAETLTQAEQQELVTMSDQVEVRTAERLLYLGELAKKRGITVAELMKILGIRPVPVSGA